MRERSAIRVSPFLASAEFHALKGKVSHLDEQAGYVELGKAKAPLRSLLNPLLLRCIAVEGKVQVLSAYNPSSRSGTWEIDGNPCFWQEVKQLSFAFEDKKWEAIQAFYSRYGPVKPIFLSATIGVDYGFLTQNALLWFRHLTNLVAWIKNEKVSALREFFKEGNDVFFQPSFYGTPRIRALPLNREEGLSLTNQKTVMLVLRAVQDETLRQMEILERLREVAGRAQREMKDSELIPRAWDLVALAVGEKLASIELVPVRQQSSKLMPPVIWYFRAYCALDAAFLQWYFQELAPLTVKTCEAPGCNGVVLDPRAKYCSSRCYERVKKRRYLERKRRKKHGTE